MSPAIPQSDTEQELRNTLASGSASTDDYRRLADLLVELDRHEEAPAVYEQALARPADSLGRARLIVELGELCFALNRMPEAEAFAHQALALLTEAGSGPRVASCRGAAQSLLVRCLVWTDPIAARVAARQGLESLEPALASVDALPADERIWARIDAASLHSSLGDHEKAIAHCEPALQEVVAPKDRFACISVYAEALSAAGRAHEGRDLLLDQIGGAAPRRALPWLHLQLATVQRAMNDVAEARDSLLHALDTTQTHPATRNDHRLLMEIWGNRGLVAHQLELYEEAEHAYREGLGHSQSLGGTIPACAWGSASASGCEAT